MVPTVLPANIGPRHPMLAVDLGLFLARTPVGDFGWGPPCTGVPKRNGRATGGLARPGSRPGGRPLVPLGGPQEILEISRGAQRRAPAGLGGNVRVRRTGGLRECPLLPR